MKFRISVSEENFESVKEFLSGRGIEIGDDGEYVISEAPGHTDFIAVRNDKKERMRLKTDEVIYIEAFGITQETLNRETIDVDRTIPNDADFTFRMEIVTKSGFKIEEQTLMVYSELEDYDDYEYLRVYDINGNLLWEDDYK